MIAENEQEIIDHSNSQADTDGEDNIGVDDDIEQPEQVTPPTPPKPRRSARLAAKALKESEQSVLLTLLHKNETAKKVLFTSAWAAIKEHGRPAYKAVASETKQLFKTKAALKPINK